MVRNVELYGAAAVVLFPDPISYIITQDGATGKLETNRLAHMTSNDHMSIVNFPELKWTLIIVGNLPTDVTLTHSVKYFPGDPASPYIDDISSNHSKGFYIS